MRIKMNDLVSMDDLLSKQREPGSLETGLAIGSELLRCQRYADHRADDFAGDHEFHPPILLPPVRGIVGSHRHGLTETRRADRVRRHSLLNQVVANRSATILRKLLVVVVGADAV